ncbi:hypothetical protein [Sphingomonas kyeonggiensis]|uniref:Uncharacterized protein n=1 Tax=Sphingomonas kyeonggiensis TaxID=1268553 RepID=A0A7W6NXS7_9SPHN|nr:hypothetical protein [Sphingomonas kyeonggiensis]MBB4099967.1 hypothetical protein [Sphingomonas kyeonggiensis]
MNKPTTFTNYAFQISIWGVIAVAASIAIAGIVDLFLQLGWGFLPKDIVMAVIVLAVAIAMKVVGTKIISFFGGGL